MKKLLIMIGAAAFAVGATDTAMCMTALRLNCLRRASGFLSLEHRLKKCDALDCFAAGV